MSFFSQNSAFQQLVTPKVAGPPKPSEQSHAGVATKQLEDWAYRVTSAANEAHDEHLGALESDLLDLRDDIVFALHSAI